MIHHILIFASGYLLAWCGIESTSILTLQVANLFIIKLSFYTDFLKIGILFQNAGPLKYWLEQA